MSNNRGITIISLVATIAIISILVGISIKTGNNIIKETELENLKTDMLLIKIKGKEYVENANFKLGANIETASDKETKILNAKDELKGKEITNINEFGNNLNITSETLSSDNSNYIYYYKLYKQDLMDIGISNVNSDEKNGWYIVKYDIKNIQVEVYNTKGFEEGEQRYYSLNEIQNLEI